MAVVCGGRRSARGKTYAPEFPWQHPSRNVTELNGKEENKEKPEKREGKAVTVAENVEPTRSNGAVITWQTRQLLTHDHGDAEERKGIEVKRAVSGCRSPGCLEKRKNQTDHQLERKKYETWQAAYGWEGMKIAHEQCVKKGEDVKSAKLYIGYNVGFHISASLCLVWFKTNSVG
jgi:hypothetical protein